MRATEKKRKPFITAPKWIVLIVVFILLILSSIILYYKNIYEDRWTEQNYVISSLREYFDIDTIDYSSKYIWDEAYWIVKGKTESNVEKFVVWKDLNIIFSSTTDVLLTEKQLISQLELDDENINISYMQPAFYKGVLCYEVQTINEEGYKLYSFYSMENGKLLDQFTIPK